MYRLPTLFLLSLIVLVETASARPPSGFGRPAKDTSSDSETNWYLGERDAVVKQTSRNEILTRGRQKAARQQVDAAHKRWLGPGLSQRPGTFGQRSKRALSEPAPAGVSAVPGKRGMRLECPVDGVEAGWARFPGWELEWDDIPGQAFETSSEDACIRICSTYGSGCAGVQYVPEYEGSNCYLKAPAVKTGHFTSTSAEAQSQGAVLVLVGTCDGWTPRIPMDMDAVCCDT